MKMGLQLSSARCWQMVCQLSRPKPDDGLVDVTYVISDCGNAALPSAAAAVTGSSFKLARGAPGLISKRYAPPKKKKDKQKKREERDGNVQEKEGLRKCDNFAA